MKYYMAPLEGITGFIYRNAYDEFFGGIDKYFTPFIQATQNRKMRSRELNDVLPENNRAKNVIPQILTNNADDFIETSKRLKQHGYNEVNLNLGCPSGTVVAKGKGAGFLDNTTELRRFFDKVFDARITKISVKTRIGRYEPEEFYNLIKIYNDYEMSELIIHPRIQQDYYKNKPNLEVFADAVELSTNKLCYNGDIFKVEDYDRFTDRFPQIDTIMLGRGLVGNPALIEDMKTKKKTLTKENLRGFHDRILEDYLDYMASEIQALYKMKELWFYMIKLFAESDKHAKKIKKANKISEYRVIVSSLFAECELV